MSIAYATCNDHKRNLVLSRPDIHYFIEDLMIQLSLEEMKSIFHSCVALVRERLENDIQLELMFGNSLTILLIYC
jgi:hypothetical protein